MVDDFDTRHGRLATPAEQANAASFFEPKKASAYQNGTVKIGAYADYQFLLNLETRGIEWQTAYGENGQRFKRIPTKHLSAAEIARAQDALRNLGIPFVEHNSATLGPTIRVIDPHGLAKLDERHQHVPRTPAVRATASAVRGGIIPALAVGAAAGAYSLATGSSPAEAARNASATAGEGLVHGSSNGFSDVIGPNVRPVDRLLNGANTATGTIATAATLATAIPGAQPVSIPTAGAAFVANLGVNLLRDVAHAAGLSDQPGLIGSAAAAVQARNRNIELFDRVDQALNAGSGIVAPNNLDDLRSNRALLEQQLRDLGQFNPNRLRKFGEPPALTPPPIVAAEGRTLSGYHEIRGELMARHSAAHQQYFTAVLDTARAEPEAIARLIGNAPDRRTPDRQPVGAAEGLATSPGERHYSSYSDGQPPTPEPASKPEATSQPADTAPKPRHPVKSAISTPNALHSE